MYTATEKNVGIDFTQKELTNVMAALTFWNQNIAKGADGMREALPAPYRQFFDTHDPMTDVEITELLIGFNLRSDISHAETINTIR